MRREKIGIVATKLPKMRGKKEKEKRIVPTKLPKMGGKKKKKRIIATKLLKL